MDVPMPRLTCLVLAAGLAGGCAPKATGSAAGSTDGRPLLEEVGEFTGLPDEPAATASSPFWAWWGDGKAEMSGYRITTPRYGEPRQGRLVLIYVTEPHDRRTWIKDDAVEPPHRVEVMKLNASLEFLTGIYPYSVLTSVFAPVDDYLHERFQPVKLTLSAQEWCGHVYHALWPGRERFRSVRLSYFADEGEGVAVRDVDGEVLYEDALLIQLRELDGPFAEGGDWEGWLVPSLWDLRRRHRAAVPVRASITRGPAERDGVPVTRFVVRSETDTWIVDVEREPPRRVLGWRTSDGEEAELLETERLAYWRLNGPEGRRFRARLGLDAPPTDPPDTP